MQSAFFQFGSHAPNGCAKAVSRRRYLVAAVLAASSVVLPARKASAVLADGDLDEADEIAKVQSIAKTSGLGTFSISRSDHFLAIGDAPEAFRAAALAICEDLAKVVLAYFGDRGFKVVAPRGRMTVMVLKDDRSYQAFTGSARDEKVGGHYDLETNRLVVFDFRPNQGALEANAERVNLFTLVHETAHLLSYNVGVLSRQSDVPVAVSEGIATVFEMWRPDTQKRPRRKTPAGAINRPRLEALVAAGSIKGAWIPIAKVLGEDELLRDANTCQIGYAESWLLIHYLLTTPAQLPRLKAYLSDLPPSNQAAKRQVYAELTLGSLKKLDHELQLHAQRMLRK